MQLTAAATMYFARRWVRWDNIVVVAEPDSGDALGSVVTENLPPRDQ